MSVIGCCSCARGNVATSSAAYLELWWKVSLLDRHGSVIGVDKDSARCFVAGRLEHFNLPDCLRGRYSVSLVFFQKQSMQCIVVRAGEHSIMTGWSY